MTEKNNVPIHLLSNVPNDEFGKGVIKNIKKYLNNFKILTDAVELADGYIVNFGIFFDIVAEKYANKQLVKLRCIQKIKNYSNRFSRKFFMDPQSWQKSEKIENPWIFVIKILDLSKKLFQIAKNQKINIFF